MCDDIYKGNTNQTLKKIMYGHFSDILPLLKNVQKLDSFATHFEHHFNTIASSTDIRKYISFIVVDNLNLIGAMKSLQNPTETYLLRNI